jgi:hypothetical protein
MLQFKILNLLLFCFPISFISGNSVLRQNAFFKNFRYFLKIIAKMHFVHTRITQRVTPMSAMRQSARPSTTWAYRRKIPSSHAPGTQTLQI